MTRLHLPGPASCLDAPGAGLEVHTPDGARRRHLRPVLEGAGLRPSVRTVAAGFDDPVVFSIDDRSLQVTWSGSEAGELTVEVGDRSRTVAAAAPARADVGGRTLALSRLPAGPGAVVVDGLDPATAYDVWVTSRWGRHPLGTVVTLPTPPGAALGRFATVTDIHIGEHRFGVLARRQAPGYTLRAFRAAVDEARAWGAGSLVVKGDVSRDSEPGELAAAAELLAGCGLPLAGVLGNHDQRPRRSPDPLVHGTGERISRGTRSTDVAGVRLVLTTTLGDHRGTLPDADADAVVAAVAGDQQAVVVLHHPPVAGLVTPHHPPGLGWRRSAGLLERLRAANPATLVLAGHTHRNRVRWGHGLVCVETGSTKDFPGVWSGYAVYEGGIVQTTRRIAAPEVIAFSEATRGVLAGQWGRWSPGLLADRCFTFER